MQERLFIGINGHVVAIDKVTGEQCWRTKLKSASITVVSSDGDRVFAAASGFLYCLNGADGAQLWCNQLKGLGYGTCIIDSNQSVANHHSASTAASLAAVTDSNSFDSA